MVRASERASSQALAARLLASLAGVDADGARERFVLRAKSQGVSPSDDAKDLGALVAFAYPELGKTCRASDIASLARGTKVARDVRTYRKLFFSSLSDLTDEAMVRKRLREFAAREKLRVAIRELLYADIDVDVTARELSDLAEVCIDVALSSAMLWGEARFGVALSESGVKVPIAIIGMGKLGGRELNAGSDVDLFVVYDTDDGSVTKTGQSSDLVSDVSIHELMTRVIQRMVQTLEDVTDDGTVWRVDMRLRPEGASGPLVNSLAALESYYETWGRTWERAALLRGRAVAGDLAFGAKALAALSPFVWRRVVNPLIARELKSLVVRARAEGAREDDLKLGVGGIREAEFFVQSLQLIWGGRDASLRTVNTIDAARRLRTRGFVTEREARDLVEAYVFLRRLEHRVQFATMRQTHEFPEPVLAELISKTTGLGDAKALRAETVRVKKNVSALLASLDQESAPPNLSRERFFAALDAHDEAGVLAALPDGMRTTAAPDLPRHLVALARRPDFPLGPKTRDEFPEFADTLTRAIEDAADPEQAARLFVSFFSRLKTPGVYARALAADERATRRVTALFGGSAFLAESLLAQPELVDRLLFVRSAPKLGDARAAIDEEIAARKNDDLGEEDDAHEMLVSALRRAKSRVMLEVGLADLSGEIGLRDAAYLLTELADETLERATKAALGERGLDRGLCVVAMGKLGGRELGYGSDLDLFFVYDGPDDSAESYVRCAQRVMRLVGMPHGDGPGYELDARLRPSGNQGLLVVSLEAFARYHHASEGARAHDWERQALIKARPCAGDREVGARVLQIAHAAAFDEPPPPAEKVVEMRLRMERELAGERQAPGHARYDCKLGFGGLADVEFAVQYLQMKNGRDPRVRSTDTENALLALETCGHLDPSFSGPLREGYTFLRRLEQRLRVLHGTSSAFVEEGAFGLSLLARRMGMRDGPRGTAAQSLLLRYLAVTRDVRSAFEGVFGITTTPP